MNRPLLPAFILVTLIALLLFLPPPTVSARSGKAVTVKQRDAVITLQTNGDAQLVETWVVDFQRGGFSFAFREIPTNRLRDIVDVAVPAVLANPICHLPSRCIQRTYSPSAIRHLRFAICHMLL